MRELGQGAGAAEGDGWTGLLLPVLLQEVPSRFPLCCSPPLASCCWGRNS